MIDTSGQHRFTLAELAHVARSRPAGYSDDILASAVKREGDIFWLTPAELERLKIKYQQPINPPQTDSKSGIVATVAHGAASLAKVVVGMDAADPQTVGYRRHVCSMCPHRVGPLCGKCGCVIEAKIRLNDEVCPDEPPRWPKGKMVFSSAAVPCGCGGKK